MSFASCSKRRLGCLSVLTGMANMFRNVQYPCFDFGPEKFRYRQDRDTRYIRNRGAVQMAWTLFPCWKYLDLQTAYSTNNVGVEHGNTDVNWRYKSIVDGM